MAWVMVDTISMFRMRYVVETPDDHPEYALDTVTEQKAKEFSQQHLDEVIVSHRVVSLDEAIKVYDQDNNYLSKWSTEQKINQGFTSKQDIENYKDER